MSLNINIELVTEVLLPDGWHPVQQGSFQVGTYELVRWGSRDPATEVPEQRTKDALSDMGYTFYAPDGSQVAGPITQLQAVKLSQQTESPPTE